MDSDLIDGENDDIDILAMLDRLIDHTTDVYGACMVPYCGVPELGVCPMDDAVNLRDKVRG